MILIINTTVRDRLACGLADDDKSVVIKNIKVNRLQAEKLLLLINKVLKDTKTHLTSLSGIMVVTGPGGFSSVRLGVIAANTLSYSLDIPVVGVKNMADLDLKRLIKKNIHKFKNKRGFNMVMPFYNQSPNITKSKNKLLA